MRIYYVRHGQTVWNREQRLQGRADSPLTLQGVRHALAYGELLRDALDGETDIALRTSPLGRARQTAAIVADVLELSTTQVVEDPLLAEHDLGRFAGLRWSEIESELGVPYENARGWDFRPPDGESRREMFERAERWLAGPREERTMILVSHGGFSRTFRGAYLGLDPDQIMALPQHAHGLVYRLQDGRSEEIALPDAIRSTEG